MDGDVEYRKRRFYHTLNLSTKTKEVLNLSAEEIEERCTGMTVYKFQKIEGREFAYLFAKHSF